MRNVFAEKVRGSVATLADVTIWCNGHKSREYLYNRKPVDGIHVEKYFPAGLPAAQRVTVMRFADDTDHAYIRYSYRKNDCWKSYEVKVRNDGKLIERRY